MPDAGARTCSTRTRVHDLLTERRIVRALCLILCAIWCCTAGVSASVFSTDTPFPNYEDITGGGMTIYSRDMYLPVSTSGSRILPAESRRQRGGILPYEDGYYRTATGAVHTPMVSSGYSVHSGYRPILTQVGADAAIPMAWSSEDDFTYTTNSTNGPRRGPGLTDPGLSEKKRAPVGEAWALLAFAMLYAGYTFLRRKKTENLNKSTF